MSENPYGDCPKCTKPLGRNDYAWSGGSTEAGTQFWTVEVSCGHCDWALESDGWCGSDGEENLPEVRELVDAGGAGHMTDEDLLYMDPDTFPHRKEQGEAS